MLRASARSRSKRRVASMPQSRVSTSRTHRAHRCRGGSSSTARWEMLELSGPSWSVRWPRNAARHPCERTKRSANGDRGKRSGTGHNARIDTGPERDGSRDRGSGFARRLSSSRSRARFVSVVSPGKSHQSESFVETPQIAPSVAESCAVTVARSGWSDWRISNVIRAMSRQVCLLSTDTCCGWRSGRYLR